MFSFYELPVNYTTEEGVLQAIHVRAIDEGLDYNAPRNRTMYRDDFVSSQLNPTEWWEIKLIKIKPEYRRQGFGLNLIKKFFEDMKPVMCLIEAGITSKEMYDSLAAQGEIQNWIYTNLVPFYEKLCFIDINNTSVGYEEAVMMLYPAEIGKKLINLENETNIFDNKDT